MMDVLFLAPQPFYEERGTPIAEDLILRTLSERGDRVDVLTYHIGEDRHYENVTIHRIPNIPFIHSVPPGFSLRKVVSDFVMFLWLVPIAFRRRYAVVHAVEEAVFMALLLKWLLGVPYVYDMDSALVQQMVEKHPVLFRPLMPLLKFLERLAIRNAMAVVPVCDALSDEIAGYRPDKVVVLRDISLLNKGFNETGEDLRASLGIRGALVLYVGNLEQYQGIDLLIEAFSLVAKHIENAHLVIIGGKDEHIRKYQQLSVQHGVQQRVHLLGPRPVGSLEQYLKQADILVSPRIAGSNTPMKIYSYLDSGKPVLATDLHTHTQVLHEDVAVLAEPTPQAFSVGLLRLIEDSSLRSRLGVAGKRLVEERHTLRIFREGLNTLYGWLRDQAPDMPAYGGQNLQLYYQPIVALETGEIIGFEALARLNDPDNGLLTPTDFLSEVEERGDIIPLGRWVLEEAVRQTRRWEQEFPNSLPLTVNVNMSAREFFRPDLIEEIDSLLAKSGLDASRLRVEVDDAAMLMNTEDAARRASQLVARGVQVQIDYDGDLDELDALNEVPASAVKIDPSLLTHMDDGKRAALEHLIEFAQKSGLDVIAVGVETAEQLTTVKKMKVGYGQGFYFSHPLEGESAEELLSQAPSWLQPG